ncbi:hypothetical protein CRUP_032683, partial [Coryphaenoides rupestris]
MATHPMGGLAVRDRLTSWGGQTAARLCCRGTELGFIMATEREAHLSPPPSRNRGGDINFHPARWQRRSARDASTGRPALHLTEKQRALRGRFTDCAAVPMVVALVIIIRDALNFHEREAVQKKTFTKWVNSILSRVGCRISDLYLDLRDGRMLIKLLEVLSGERL